MVLDAYAWPKERGRPRWGKGRRCGVGADGAATPLRLAPRQLCGAYERRPSFSCDRLWHAEPIVDTVAIDLATRRPLRPPIRARCVRNRLRRRCRRAS